MLKEATYSKKFQMLSSWFLHLMETVKKDVKNEHLKKDKGFFRKYFPSTHLKNLTAEQMVPVYEKLVAEGEENFGEFIATRWLLKHTDLYDFFEERIRRVYPDFEAVEEFDRTFSLDLVQQSCAEFGPVRTYLFSVLNSVVFPEDIYRDLKEEAQRAQSLEDQKEKDCQKIENLEVLRKKYERELLRLRERYEKKLSGIQKKYLHDTELLKKTIKDLKQVQAQ